MRRISIAGSMGIVVLFGLGFNALRNADPFWASASFTVALVTISVAPVGVFARDLRTRMSWAGFALLGWASLLVWMSRLQPPQSPVTTGTYVVSGGGGGVGVARAASGSLVTQPLPPLLTEWALRRFQPASPAVTGYSVVQGRVVQMKTASPSRAGRAGNPVPPTPAGLSRNAMWRAQLISFDQVLHSVEIVLLGMVGAVLGHVVALAVDRRDGADRGQAPTPLL